MNKLFQRNGIFILVLLALSACSNLGKSYSQIDPEGALADVRKHNGYFSLQSVAPGTAKLVMRSEGSSANVAFSIGTYEPECKLQDLGSVRYSGRGVIYPWIADLTDSFSRLGEKSKGFLSYDLPPGKSVLIRGNGSWADPTSYGSCGPLFSKFTPIADRAYLVRFIWEGKVCKQNIYDATNPDSPIPVPFEAVPPETVITCQKP